jgi:DNA-binding transcriptional LysR family regulator
MTTITPPEEVLAFDALARTGSFTAAADLLGCTKSLVSLRIKALEKRLGSVLVMRTTRRVTLTEAGQRLLPYAQQMRDALEHIPRAVDEVQSCLEGPLTVSTTASLASTVLAPVLVELARVHPRLKVSVEVNNKVQDPVADQLDFCLRSHNVHDEGLVARWVGWGEEGLYAAPMFLDGQPPIHIPEDLAGQRLLMDSQDHCLELRCGECLHKLEVSAPLLTANHFNLLSRLVVDGAGIAPLPDYVAAPHLTKGELVKVLPDWHTQRWQVFLVFPYRQPMPRKCAVFLDFVLPRLRERLASASRAPQAERTLPDMENPAAV